MGADCEGNWVETDEELVARANRGERGAFEGLYRRYREWAYRLAWRWCGQAEDAQDVVQEVFIWLAGKFPGFELRARLTTVLYPAVKHTALAVRRKRRREVVRAEVPEVEGQEIERGEGELAVVLSGLSAAHREVILMRYVDEMTVEEMAAALEVPAGTVKSRLHHAVGALREDARVRRYFER
ncbi:MAG TPA: RNA polymerase sigma factor [Phycisphaerae bacterium]|nr:RNA polymerase sigma factor [Phycisphaerae bacterium]